MKDIAAIWAIAGRQATDGAVIVSPPPPKSMIRAVGFDTWHDHQPVIGTLPQTPLYLKQPDDRLSRSSSSSSYLHYHLSLSFSLSLSLFLSVFRANSAIARSSAFALFLHTHTQRFCLLLTCDDYVDIRDALYVFFYSFSPTFSRVQFGRSSMIISVRSSFHIHSFSHIHANRFSLSHTVSFSGHLL